MGVRSTKSGSQTPCICSFGHCLLSTYYMPGQCASHIFCAGKRASTVFILPSWSFEGHRHESNIPPRRCRTTAHPLGAGQKVMEGFLEE